MLISVLQIDAAAHYVLKGGGGMFNFEKRDLFGQLGLVIVQPTSLGKQNYSQKWQFGPYLAIFGHRLPWLPQMG